MFHSWKIGRIAGIDVRIHWTFWLLIGWIGFVVLAAGAGVQGTVYALGLIAAVFACIVLHELGHALTARHFGYQTRDITLLPIGGVARFREFPDSPVQEIIVAVAGPLVNAAIAAVLLVVLFGIGAVRILQPEGYVELTGTAAGFLASLLFINVAIVLFNLLPAFPMDGGRVFRAMLSMKTDRVKATNIAAGMGQFMAILFAVAGLFWNPWLLLIALFLFVAAGGEAQQVHLREAIRHVTVADAMQGEFKLLQSEDNLQTASDQLLAGSQQDFPVVDGNGVRGIVERERLVDAIRRGNLSDSVETAMTSCVTPLEEDAALTEALQIMQDAHVRSYPVVRQGSVVGLLTMENVGEFVMLQSARRGKHLNRPSAHLTGAA